MNTQLLTADYYQKITFQDRRILISAYKREDYPAIQSILKSYEHLDTPNLDSSIVCITIFDQQYPEALREIYDPPLVLYCKGNTQLLNHKRKIAIIGSRFPQTISIKSTKHIVQQLTQHDFLVVSGLASGIDGSSHLEALTRQMPTIGVIGFGFNHFYPKVNIPIFDALCQYGLVISEYPPYIKAQKWQFVARNRIIAGLVSGVVIIEAKEKSGSMLTARFALAENREIYIVGGHSLDPAYRGSNKLIQEGAKLIIDIDDILEDYPS